MSEHATRRRGPRRALALVTGLAGAVAAVLLAAGPAAAAGTPDLALSTATTAEVRLGEDATVTLTASNPAGGRTGYNLSFRDVLPAGVHYVPGSSTPAPTVLADAPAPGQTTLLFRNLADLAPASSFSLTYAVSYDTPPNPADPAADCSDDAVFCVGESFTHDAGAYANSNPRYVPRFLPDGRPIDLPISYTGSATDDATTTVVPFTVTKDVAGPQTRESETLRGVHDHPFAYHLTVDGNLVAASEDMVVDDHLPAGLEFLGCGAVDSTGVGGGTAGTNPGSTVEYPGAPGLEGTPSPLGAPYVTDPDAVCLDPAVVETVEYPTDPDGAGPLEAGVVYTHLRWTADQLGDLGPGERIVLAYMAGIPLRANTLDFGVPTPGTDGDQTANLANNRGPETVDEQQLTNHARVGGTYTGPTTAPSPVFGAGSSRTVSAEDLSLHKSGDTTTIVQGAVVRWDLLVETSEYRYAQDLAVTDTLPNGLCPIDETTDHDTTDRGPDGVLPGDECDGTLLVGDQTPSTPWTSATENADGTWTVVWSPLGDLPHSGSTQLTFFTQVRAYYQQDGADTTPVLARDSWANSSGVTGTDVRICDDGDYECQAGGTPVDGDGPSSTQHGDDSSSGQEAGYVLVDKEISAPVADPGVLDCATATWLDTPGPGDPPQYTTGDRVCYRLTVSFPPGVDYRAPLVTDFIPPNTTYETGSWHPTAANDVPVAVGPDDANPALIGDRLDWVVGTSLTGGSCDADPDTPLVPDCYLPAGTSTQTFEVVLSVIVDGDPAATTDGELVENLMKFTSTNSAGTTTALRDDVSYEVTEPLLHLAKVATPTSGLVGGSTVDYTVTVTNDGTQAAYDTEVWDVLPPELRCSDVTATAGPPGTSQTCTTSVTPHRLAWTVPGPIAPGESAALTYTVTLPGEATDHPVAPGDALTNTAGVRTYTTHPNTGGPTTVTYVPENNIDPSVTPNTEPARDDATVTTTGTTVVKDQSTGTSQAGNAESTPNASTDQATIGETVTYTVTATVPAGTSVYGASLADPLSSRVTYVPGSARVTFPDGTTWAQDGSAGSLPTGFAWSMGGNGTTPTLTFPTRYDNAAGSGADEFRMTFSVTVDDEAANTRTSGSIANTATFRTNDSTGTAVTPTVSGTTSTQVVEPLVTLTKTSSAVAPVAGGAVVHYTVRATNSSASRVSTANDLVVVDTIPAGLTSTAPTSITGGGVAADGPPRTITWTVATLAPGASVVLEYDVTVDDAVLAGRTYTNTADLDLSSMPGAVPGEREYSRTTGTPVTIVSPTVVKTVSPGTRTIGEAATYTLTVTLPSATQVFDATVVDELPDGVTFDGYLTATCDQGGAACTGVGLATLTPEPNAPSAGRTRLGWFLGDVGSQPADRVLTLTYAAYVDPTRQAGAVVAGSALDNSAGLVWNQSDKLLTPAPGAGPSAWDVRPTPVTARLTVVEPALTIDKDVAGQVGDTDTRAADVDEVLTYTVTVTNATGATVSPAHDVTVVDTVDPALVVDPASITGGGTHAAGPPQTITWEVPGPLAPGASVSWTYQAEVGASDAFDSTTRLPNTAEVTQYAGVAEADRLAEPDRTYRTYTGPSDTVVVDPDAPALAVDKSSTGPAVVGEPFTWTVRVTNTSAAATALDVGAVDTLPASWTYVGPTTLTPPTGPATEVTPDPTAPLTYTHLGDLAPGQSLTLTLVARPELAARGNADHENVVAVTATDRDGNPGNGDGPYTATDTDDPGLAGSRLGDRVWEDLDGDGVQDAGEPSIAGATVTVTWAGPDGDLATTGDNVVIATQTTGADGLYGVDDLPHGVYRVDVTVPPVGYVATADPDGTATASTAVTVLDPGETDLTVDFGYQRQADLAVVKTVDDGELLAGETAVFRVGVGNNGPATALAPVVVTDTLPAGLTPVGATGTDWACDPPAGQVITCTYTGGDGSLAAAGTTPEIVVEAVVAGDAASSLVNTAHVGSPTADPDPDNSTATAEVGATPAADLVIQKAHATADLVVGTTGTYTLLVANAGPSASVGTPEHPIRVTDTLPDGLVPTSATGAAPWTCTITGQTVTCDLVGTVAASTDLPVLTLEVDVTAAAEDDDLTVVNTATVAPGTTVDPEPGNNTDSDPTLVRPSADLSVTKVATGDVVVGEEVTYELTVANAGPSAARPDLTLADSLPTGLTFVSATSDEPWACGVSGQDVTCTLGEPLASDAQSVVLLTVAVDETVAPDVVNVGTVHSPTFDPDPTDNSSTTQDPTVPTVDLVISKSHVADAQVGRPAAYTLTVGNNGPSVSDRTVTVTDDVPAGLTPTAADGGADWSCTITGQLVTCTTSVVAAAGETWAPITVTVDVLPAAYPSVVNTATVTASPDVNEPDTSNNTATDPTPVLPLADLTVEKTHAGDLAYGRPAAYDVRVTNLGPTPAPGPVTVVDTLPVGMTFAGAAGDGWACTEAGGTVTCTYTGDPLAVGASTTLTLDVVVAPAAEGDVVNSVTVSSPAVDPQPGNNTDEDPTTVLPSADLSVTKSHTGDLQIGTEGTWTLLVTNAGPSSSAGPITVADQVPGGLQVLSAAGDGWVCTVTGQDVACTRAEPLGVGTAPAITLTVVPQVGTEGDLVNTAEVTGSTVDPHPENNRDEDPAVVLPLIDLSFTKTLEGQLVAGENATWVLTTSNAGPSGATDVVVVDELPAALTYVSGTGDGWTCSAVGQTVTCRFAGTLAAGADAVVRIVTRVSASAGTSVVNAATVTGGGEVAQVTETADATGTVRPAPETLPSTGADLVPLVAASLLLVGGGTLLVGVRRRRS